jgi:hypothetical protein
LSDTMHGSPSTRVQVFTQPANLLVWVTPCMVHQAPEYKCVHTASEPVGLINTMHGSPSTRVQVFTQPANLLVWLTPCMVHQAPEYKCVHTASEPVGLINTMHGSPSTRVQVFTQPVNLLVWLTPCMVHQAPGYKFVCTQWNLPSRTLGTRRVSSQHQKFFLSGYSNTCTVLQQTKLGLEVSLCWAGVYSKECS